MICRGKHSSSEAQRKAAPTASRCCSKHCALVGCPHPRILHSAWSLHQVSTLQICCASIPDASDVPTDQPTALFPPQQTATIRESWAVLMRWSKRREADRRKRDRTLFKADKVWQHTTRPQGALCIASTCASVTYSDMNWLSHARHRIPCYANSFHWHMRLCAGLCAGRRQLRHRHGRCTSQKEARPRCCYACAQARHVRRRQQQSHELQIPAGSRASKQSACHIGPARGTRGVSICCARRSSAVLHSVSEEHQRHTGSSNAFAVCVKGH